MDNHECESDERCCRLKNKSEDFCAKDKLVEDLKGLFRVVIMLLPVPMFWALFEQQKTLPDAPSSTEAFVSVINAFPDSSCEFDLDVGEYGSRRITANNSLVDDKDRMVMEVIRIDHKLSYDRTFRFSRYDVNYVDNSDSSGKRSLTTTVHTIAPENRINILWQIPQYFVITIAEILFSVSGLEFAYQEASTEMKSIVQAIWLLTNAIGNVIIMAVANTAITDNLTSRISILQAIEMFIFAAAMAAVMLVFILLAAFYYTYKSNADNPGEKRAELVDQMRKIDIRLIAAIAFACTLAYADDVEKILNLSESNSTVLATNSTNTTTTGNGAVGNSYLIVLCTLVTLVLLGVKA
ncbi:hypothetical protein TELCIR_07563 [Teladorsagia circumcincta]|uniref:Uncharacterized protein n=1 Tax=Teladorsagia circumcincta TaxID=45464 RepID=A0A2G9UJY9_TELCI|nr:hypothetical protein TELCIR_07563 [Teladorsagia circumcincta]